jgi:hypothetical protein
MHELENNEVAQVAGGDMTVGPLNNPPSRFYWED